MKSIQLILTSLISFISANDAPHKRFEYKYSFKGPQLTQMNGLVPFWIHSGHAIASEEQIRLTPSLRSRAGVVWNKKPTTFDSWEIEVWIRVSGKSRVGADGMALWYTAERGSLGRVFGGSDGWNGLMIMLDSFDNNGQSDNPMVGVILNDGTQAFDHQNDGQHQLKGSCRRDYRNKVYPVKIKVIYRNNMLLVLYDQGLTDFEDYEVCAKIQNVNLPEFGYFGVSAATGGLADDHDVLKFLTYSLSEKTGEEIKVDTAQQEKYDKNKKEFAEIQKKAQEDAGYVDNADQIDVSDLEIKRIYEVTSAIHRHVQESHQLLADVRKYLVQAANKIGGTSSGGGGSSEVTKYDINLLKSQSSEVVKMLNEMKQNIKTLEYKASGQVNPNHGGGGSNIQASHLNSIAQTKVNTDNILRTVNDMKNIQKSTESACASALNNKGGSYGGDSDCVTTGTLMMFTIIQAGIIVAAITWLQKSGLFVNKQKFF